MASLRPFCYGSCPLLLLLLLLSVNADEDVCDSSLGSCSKPASRTVVEKTPTPCLEKYSEEHVQSSAGAHVRNIKGGHEVPHLLVLLGGSGAGKGTFIKHLTKHGLDSHDFVFHGLDEYLVYLPEFQSTINDTSAVYKDAADACYGGGAIPIAKAVGNKIIAGRLNVIYEETGKNLDRILKRVLPPFEEAGFRITVALVDNHVEIAKARAEHRFLKEGRYAPPDYIEGTFKNVPENFKKLRQTGKVKEAVYCDNSCMGSGKPLEEAVEMSGCLLCWRDGADVSAGSAGDTAQLIPDAALGAGAPKYLNAGAR